MRGHVQPYKRKVDGEWKIVRGKYRCFVDLGYHDGKRVRESFVFEGGKKEAEAEVEDRLSKLRDSSVSVGPVTGTVGEWLDEWLRVYIEPKTRDGQLAASTLTSYRAVVRRYLKPELGSIPLKKLKPEQVMALYATMAKPKDEGGYGVSPRTRELAHVTLRAALGKALALGRVRFNVLDKDRGVDRPKVPRRDVTALEPEAAVSLLTSLAKADGPDARLFLPAFIALATAMRRGEILALRWDEVTLPSKDEPEALGKIEVSRAWDCSDVPGRTPLERYRLKGPKSGKSRVITIGPDVVSVLRVAKAEQAARKLASSAWYTSSKRADGSVLDWGDLVVSDEHGFPLWPNSFSSMWLAWCKREDVSCRFHDLRATSLSIALSNGVDPKVLMDRAGHHSAAFFLERYAKALNRATEMDAGIMGELVRQVPSQSGTQVGHTAAK